MNRKQIEQACKKLKDSTHSASVDRIVDTLLCRYMKSHGIERSNLIGLALNEFSNEDDIAHVCRFVPCDFSLIDIMFIYEGLLSQDIRAEKGITFTPEFIAEYIVKKVVDRLIQEGNELCVIDPACGTGIFLLKALIYLHSRLGGSIWDVFDKYIFGLDIVNNNVILTRKILAIAAQEIEPRKVNVAEFNNIRCEDALKLNWEMEFGRCFNGIVGNPPYVNPHDLPKSVKDFLKKTFVTTASGTTNIYYAFIEHAMRYLANDGSLCYIIPNNFITINAAKDLRRFIVDNRYIHHLVDFTDNMLFAPVRTYNAIIELRKEPCDKMQYTRICSQSTDAICKSLIDQPSSYIDYSYLQDDHRWTLLDSDTQENIRKIESHPCSIKQFVRTGIATLRDNIYLVDSFENGRFFKSDGNKTYCIESDIVRPIYKISEINSLKPIESSRRYIIFPYRLTESGKHEIIPEEVFCVKYPQAYEYLKSQRKFLDERDNGKPNAVSWYAYGRSQGINLYGRKLLYPTFASTPRFMLVDDVGALFCNGYALFEYSDFPIELLQKVLNSCVMKYYVDKTSYPIEGGFVCYQKKYIERFSVPLFSAEEKAFLLSSSSSAAIDIFLLKKYGLPPSVLDQLYN